MKVTVEYFAQLRTTSGLQEESYELSDGSAVADLVHAIKARHQGAFAEFLGGENALPGWITVIQGEEPVSTSAPLADDATIRFLAPISGG